METIKVGSDFSGIGAFDESLKRLQKEIDFNTKNVFACDMDKFARISYLANNEHPLNYPTDVYEREIPSESLDIYMTSPPCQAFSIAGKRKGKEDKRGILFFNSLEFIETNKPRFFIFENVKGLLSHDKPKDSTAEFGRTFQEWINYLGGKSVNGVPVIFPYEDSVPYHIHFKVINAKNHGVPQNRERIFIIGIRDDDDNSFTFQKEIHLEKRLKDVLEPIVNKKYHLSETMIAGLLKHKERHDEKGTGFSVNFKDENDIATTIRANAALSPTDNILKLGFINQDTQASQVFSDEGISPTIAEGTHGYAMGYVETDEIILINNPTHSNNRVYSKEGIAPTIKTMSGGNQAPFIEVKSATKSGFEVAKEGDSVNLAMPKSKTRRGRVGVGVAQTLDTSCNQGVCIPVLTPDRAEKRQNGRRFKEDGDEMFTITTQDRHGIYDGVSIRKLTPLECFRLMDFSDEHFMNCVKAGISDSQLYKQAGNSIVVKCLEDINRKIVNIILKNRK